MRGFVDLSIKVANAFGFQSKLYFIVGIFLIPFLVLSIREIGASRQAEDLADMQLNGVELAQTLKETTLHVATHRGLMAQYLGGAVGNESAILTEEKAVSENIASLKKQITNYGYPLKNIDSLEKYASEFQLNNLRGKSPGQSFALHSSFVEDLHHQTNKIADFYSLTITPTKDLAQSVYLVAHAIPELAESLGKLRGKTAGALADKNINAAKKLDVSIYYSHARSDFENLYKDIELYKNDSKITSNLSEQIDSSKKKTTLFLQLVESEVIAKEEVSITGPAVFTAGTEAILEITKLDTLIFSTYASLMQEAKTAAQQQFFTVVTTTVVLLVLGAFFTLGILGSLVKNTKDLKANSLKLKEGDLTVNFDIPSEDTLGEAGRALSIMTKSVAALIEDIQHSAQEVNALSVKLQEASDKSKSELDDQSMQTSQAASAATEMAATIRDVARNCTDMSSATDDARAFALVGQTRVDEAVQCINALGSDVDQARNIISQLQDDAADIGTVLEVIRSIAEQTNLLALNAAIEAARAGEQGRGFAVVADEVRSLAKRTADSTAEIRQVIERLQQRAESAVGIIQHSYQSSQESVSAAASAGGSLQNIVGAVEKLRDFNLQIATAAEQQAAVAEQMSRNTQALSDAAENILVEIDNTVICGRELRGRAKGLLDNTLKFKTS